ncbi:hypothetical protein KXW07_008185 [Aspergillus fumigatus]|nr:hypothetical protein KXW07_008185 [Aspergillus fumigatus]
MHTSTIEPSSSLLAFIRQSGRPKGPSSAMKLVEVILLALSSDIPAQLFACGLEYRAGYCGQQPCGQPYPGVGVGLPPPSPPCLSQYPMQCVPVPQQYGALNCICSGNSGIYQGGDYLYPPPLPPPPPPIPHLRWRRHISTTATAAPRATTKVSPGCVIQNPETEMHPASDTQDMATPGRDREDGDYGDGQYAQPGHYQGDMDDDWSIRPGHQPRPGWRSRPGKTRQGPGGSSPGERRSDPRHNGHCGGSYCTRHDHQGNCLTRGRQPPLGPDPVEEGRNTLPGGHDWTSPAGSVGRCGEWRERGPKGEQEEPGAHERGCAVDPTELIS